MAYSADLAQAAQRHFDDAKILQDKKRFSNAGYHYGLSAECAIKSKLQEIWGHNDHPDIHNAMYAHFPEMRNTVLAAIGGRSANALRNLLDSPAFMQNWHIRMRYADNNAVQENTVKRWHKDANASLGVLLS